MSIVFVTESIENIPQGYKAKESFQFTGEIKFTESLELAESGKGFEVYFKAILKKAN